MSSIDLGELQKALIAAQEAYLSCKQEEDTARRNATAALNNVNAAQRALDDGVEKLRAQSPHSSDWKQKDKARFKSAA